jgi:surfactin synthase thioesterase subunit
VNSAALRALADAADALARLARAAAEDSPDDPSALLPIARAARAAGTSVRVVKDAIRRGDLSAFGGQRDRTVRRADIDRWIESRRSKAVAGPDDPDIERRILRLSRRAG